MTESRHVASLVRTEGRDADMDLLIETLEEREFVRVERVDDQYADIVIDELAGEGGR